MAEAANSGQHGPVGEADPIDILAAMFTARVIDTAEFAGMVALGGGVTQETRNAALAALSGLVSGNPGIIAHWSEVRLTLGILNTDE